MQLQFNTESREDAKTSDPNAVNITSDEAFAAMSRFDEIGIWRAELESGLVYWTESVYRI